ncbi:hypothetical protein INT45_007742 [Circinella minor]|uniref:Tc1-like transposase DDE domain-containing protein n=1 Tax=Circinella minor TaxID=1195481 RepID=A0A8H7VHX8_9FUNG|nr:hypothetical protein INT45_007742 [Circinella minor]
MAYNSSTDACNTAPEERIVLFRNYMDWGGAAGINHRQKMEEEKGRKEKALKGPTSSNDISSRQPRGSYNTKNDIKVAKMINLLQEFEGMSISVAARNQLTGAKSKLTDDHTVFIFEKIHEQPTISCSDVTNLLCQHFKGLDITSRAVNEHMRKKCHLTYKRTVRQLDARDDDTNILQRYESVSAWIALGIYFFSECIFIDEVGFNRNMHRSQGWSEVGSPCKITTETKGPNISILGAINVHGVITLSRREACAPTNKKRKANDPASKKGTTSSDFMEFLEQVLTNIEAHDLPYRYLVMDNAAIHKTIDVKDWVTERGFEIIYLPPYSSFLNPIEEFWSKLKDVVNKDPASVILNTKLSDRIKRAPEYIFREDCQAWIKHSLRNLLGPLFSR